MTPDVGLLAVQRPLHSERSASPRRRLDSALRRAAGSLNARFQVVASDEQAASFSRVDHDLDVIERRVCDCA